MSAPEEESRQKEGEPAGEVLYCGGTSWETMGRRPAPANGNLVSPTRLRPLMGVDIRSVASGCASCHCVALDVEGRCFTWGRNEKGQLGHGDTLQRNLPTIVYGLSKYKIVKAGAGRNHTVVVTDDGKSFAFGWNKHGQLGTGSARTEIERSPVPCTVSQVTSAVCGADFTVWLSSLEGSSIFTAGLPQYGQLGHGTDNKYNTKDSSIRLAYEAQPRPKAIAAFSGKTVVKVACGTNHTVAADSSGFVYTWGFGGYGRLGHREQKDEWVPRLVDVFQKKNVLPPTAIVSAGSANSACTAGGGQLYMWGKLKSTGDDWMYPKPVMDLSGWNINCMDSGNMHHVVGADESCISWGLAQHGELGYGPLGQKSSSNPKKVDLLEGMRVTSVACGMGLSLIVVDRAIAGDKLNQLEVYDGGYPGVAGEGEEAEPAGAATKAAAAPRKRAAASAKAPMKKNKKKNEEEGSSESESGDDSGDTGGSESDGDSGDAGGEVPAAGKRNRGGARGRGRGRGRGRPPKSAVAGGGRGRGRGRAGKKVRRS